MTEDQAKKKAKISRRTALKYGGAVVIAAAVVAAGGYEISRPQAPPAMTNATSGSTSATSTPFAGTLQLFAWDYNPQIIQKHLADFTNLYGTNVNLNVIPYPSYLPSIQSKIMGGDTIDDIYVELVTQLKWFNAGWIRALDDLPGADEIKTTMFPAWLPRYIEPKTQHLITLPYWVGCYVNMTNDKFRTANGFDWPQTLDDIHDQCQKFAAKGMKAPYTAYWSSQLEENFVAYCANEGLDLFDASGNPQFQNNNSMNDVLDWMNSMVQDKCTSPTILTDDVGSITTAWLNGDSYINHWHTYFQETYNRSGQGPQLGNCKLPPVPPGSAHKTMAVGDNYGMMTRAQDVTSAWELLRFMGAVEPKTGKLEVATDWALQTGLMSPYPTLWNDPTVQSSIGTWSDFALFQQYVQNFSSPVTFRENFVWYEDWVTYLQDTLGNMLVGKVAITDVPAMLATQADQLRESA